ncbi:MAG: helix-turn-helix transcriptional regulator [Pseudonocardia sp.]
MGEYEPRNFLQPCLLLLLRERSDHGYELVDRLRELHAVDGDAGAVYRALRGLEKSGMVRSTWEASDAGPARRTYQVTQLGVATLDRQAHILEETHRALHLFRLRYRQLVGEVGSDAGYRAGPGHPVIPNSGQMYGSNGAPANGTVGNGTVGNGTVGNGSRGNRATGIGSRGNGAAGDGAAGSGSCGHGTGGRGAGSTGNSGNGVASDGRRRNGNGGTVGGAPGGPGGRGVRPPRPPGQRTGR